MFKINRLKLVITKMGSIDPKERYGFDIPFETGLNIIAGQNSQGKSTVGSCIYYALGMEELLELGTKNERALGKALKLEFETINKENNEITKNKVLYSRIFIEIENDRSETVTIMRHINSGDFNVKGADNKTKTATVFFSAIKNLSSKVESRPLFLRNHNNNTDEYGFYQWLATFIGLEIPEVVNVSKEGRSPLYLQAVFTASFIEQTKGWSEFLATIPYFGIAKAKQKVIEYLLDLKELSISTERDDIIIEEGKIVKKWANIVNRLDVLAGEFFGYIKGLPEDLTGDRDALNSISLIIKDDEVEGEKSIQFLYEHFNSILENILELPIKTVGENKEQIRKRLEELYYLQLNFMTKFEKFDISYNLQKSQLENISKQLTHINKELVAQKGIQNIIQEALIMTSIYDKCPTCQQTVSDDLMQAEGITVEKYTLAQNVAYLSGQQNMIKSSIKGLSSIIEEKQIMRKYYTKKQRELEEEIKIVLRELIDDDRKYSDVDSLKRVRLERKVHDLKYGQATLSHYISELAQIADEYKALLLRKGNLETSTEEDGKTLDKFEMTFKSDYLFSFGYDSNRSSNVFIQREDPFKYFPVFKFSNEDGTLPQSIKTNSSASDFVRTMWAYTLSLLVTGKNHPGVIIFDEPGQHSVKSQSLRALFEKSAAIKDRQTIILTSVEKVLARNGDKIVDRLDLDSILDNLIVNRDYHIYKFPDQGKVIDKIQ